VRGKVEKAMSVANTGANNLARTFYCLFISLSLGSFGVALVALLAHWIGWGVLFLLYPVVAAATVVWYLYQTKKPNAKIRVPLDKDS
jgi:dipeptide/tripeptide permease